MQRRTRSEDGVEIAYGDFGPADGEPVVLCHGLCASGRQFAADAAYFAGLGYRVLVPDLRGHGQSGAPPGFRTADFTLERLAGDMLAMLEEAGAEPVHWVGNSLGGIVALKMIETAAARLKTLATFGTSYRLALPGFVPHLLPLLYRVPGRRLVAELTARATTDDRAGRRLIAEMLRAFEPEAGRAVAEHVRRYDLIASALGYPGPILLIRGDRDRGVNAALGPTLAAMAGRAYFTRVDLARAGHCANLDAPQAMRRTLVTFWRQEKSS